MSNFISFEPKIDESIENVEAWPGNDKDFEWKWNWHNSQRACLPGMLPSKHIETATTVVNGQIANRSLEHFAKYYRHSSVGCANYQYKVSCEAGNRYFKIVNTATPGSRPERHLN